MTNTLVGADNNLMMPELERHFLDTLGHSVNPSRLALSLRAVVKRQRLGHQYQIHRRYPSTM
jgi:hypothetical protein